MLKKLLLAVAVLTSTLTLTINAAEAARIGGGRSIGSQRSIAPRQATPPQQAARPAAAPNTPAAPAQSGWRKWAGPLAGIAAAVGLASLLSHFGMGGDFAGIMLLVIGGLVAFMLIRKFMSRNQPAEPALAGVPNAYTREAAPQAAFGGGASQSDAASRFPAGFDAETFARQAKLNFIRLQAANDACNLADIRDFTSPEMFAEIKLAIDERGGKTQRTDIILLEVEVVEVVEEKGQYIASVHCSGSLREEEGGAPQAFSELWHLSKPVDGNRGWALSGIQQYS